MSAYKARQVLDLIRGQDADRAAEILALGDREAAVAIGKVLASAVANAVHNDGIDAEELYVSACFADEGGTLKRWRPRARGRATRIRKRTCHITVIVSRMPEDRMVRRRAKQAASGAQRSRRVAGSRRNRRGEGDLESTEGQAPELVLDDLSTGLADDVIDAEATEVDAEIEIDADAQTAEAQAEVDAGTEGAEDTETVDAADVSDEVDQVETGDEMSEEKGK
jgi:large subunit ribosomal protein L22